jgi:hypothetical protein
MNIANWVVQIAFAINGTCGEGNVTKRTMNQTLISNLMSEGYQTNLTTDNPQLAELIKAC